MKNSSLVDMRLEFFIFLQINHPPNMCKYNFNKKLDF